MWCSGAWGREAWWLGAQCDVQVWDESVALHAVRGWSVSRGVWWDVVWCGTSNSLVRAASHCLAVPSSPAALMFSAALANKCVKFAFERSMEPMSRFQK